MLKSKVACIDFQAHHFLFSINCCTYILNYIQVKYKEMLGGSRAVVICLGFMPECVWKSG